MSWSEVEAAAATDRAAVDRFHDGEWAAFDELYERHLDRLLGYCHYRLKDRHEAEDVAQEAFVRAWRSMPTFGGDRNFYPWLRVIAANLCTDTLRKRSRSEPATELDLVALSAPEGPQDAARLEDEDDRLLVRQALARLNARHQSALLMREDEGLAYDEIAARTGESISSVESLLWRARQAFRREFTVLSAGQACLAALALPAALAGRLRHTLRTWAARVNERLGLASLGPGGSAGLHAAALGAAGVVMVTVVAAAVGVGGSAPPVARTGSSAIGASSHVLSTSSLLFPPATVQSPMVLPAGSPAGATGAGTVGAATGAGPETSPATAATTSGSPSGPVTPVGRAVNPVTTGPSAAREARSDPLSLSAGLLAVGVDPNAVIRYLHTATSNLAANSSVSAPLGSVTQKLCVPAAGPC